MVINMPSPPTPQEQVTEDLVTQRDLKSVSKRGTNKPTAKRGRKATSKTKERVQFDFSLEKLQRIDDIKEKTGATTRAETVRNALRVYEWFVETDPDNVIKVFDANKEVISAFKAKLLMGNLL